MEFIFWFSLILIVYTHLGYPAVLFIWSKLSPKRVDKKYIEPTVSVVIAAHNEKRNIKDRVENLLGQDYPRDRIEIIIVSDGSTDGTNDLIDRIAPDDVRRIFYSPRRGKAYAKSGCGRCNG